MKIVVTGGCGFIGSALVRLLLGQEWSDAHRVLTIDRLSYAASTEALADVAGSPNHALAKIDIRSGEKIAGLLASFTPDAVIHLAAETHVDRSIDDPSPFITHNIEGTFTLLEAVRRHWRALSGERRDRFRFIHVSTDEVFGALADGTPPFAPHAPYRPSSPYAASKAASDHLVRSWHHTYGLPAIVTNCTNNYGPFQFPEKLIPLTIIKALAGEPIPIYGRGDNIRDWIHVEDHARALLAALERGHPGETYLIGARCERDNLAVVETICAELDRLVPDPAGSRRRLITFVADRPGHDFRYALDPTSACVALDWSPRITFEDGIRYTVAWYAGRRDWWEPILRRRYDGHRLGILA